MRLKSFYRFLTDSDFRATKILQRRLQKLKMTPRYKEGWMNIDGRRLFYSDAASFAFMYDEIFFAEIYRFISSAKEPLIIDAGANIGLATIYFKELFPQARIIAFEPDHIIAEGFRKNLRSLELSNVQLIEKGLGAMEGYVSFLSEGADGGRVVNGAGSEMQQSDIQKIEIVRLSGFIDQPVDLLKMDIEGGELDVMLDIQSVLHFVGNLFIEYHSFERSAQELSKLLTILEQHNYRYHIENPAFTKRAPLVNRETRMGMDMQLNIFAWK